MLLGILTLALMFAAIESHPLYQARRTAAPRLARALDSGVKFRVYLAIYTMLSVLLIGSFDPHSPTDWIMIFIVPYMAEIYIGIGAMGLIRFVTGIDIAGSIARDSEMQPIKLSYAEHFFGTYLTTITTGLIHTVILALICLLAYGAVRLRSRRGKAKAGKKRHS